MKDEKTDIENESEDNDDFKPMTESEVLSFCMAEVSRGIGGSSYGEEESHITQAYDLYFGRTPSLIKSKQRDPESSRFVSMDVMDTVEATVAEIMPTFITDEIAFYNPENERDEEQSKTESDIVNYLFFDEYDGFIQLQNALRDALLTQNCTTKVYWDSRKEVEYEEYDDVPEIALVEIAKPTEPDQIVEITERVKADSEDSKDANNDEDSEELSAVEEIDGYTSGEFAQPTYNITVKRINQREKPVIVGVKPEECIIAGDHRSPTLYDVRFAAHESIETASSLIEQGYDPDIVKQLPDYNANIEAISRTRTATEFDYFESDESVRHIRVFDAFILLDVDGDGIAERRHVVFTDGRILTNETCESVSLIGGVIQIVPHVYRGMSMTERVKDIQIAKTPVIRSIVDGTRLSSNPRIGVVTNSVNIDDLLTSRTGGIVRAEDNSSVFEIPRAEVPQSSYVFLDTMDNLRRERGGSAVNTSSQAQKLANDSAHSFERSMSAMELSNALLARTFGETLIKGIFLEMHNIIRTNYRGELSRKIRGEWITTVPSEWKKRTSITISIGASNAERMRQSQAMDALINKQAALAAENSIMFDEKKAYKAIIASVSLSGVKNAQSYFINPSSEEGQAASQSKAQQSQELKQKEEEMTQAIAKSQKDLAEAEIMKGQAALQAQQVKFENDVLKNQLLMLKEQMAAAKNDNDLAFKYEELNTNASIKVTDLELTHDQELNGKIKENKDE